MTIVEQKQQAAIILKQLGGQRFIAMTGAKNLVCDEKGITFKFMKNAIGAKWCTINLNSLDLYDMTFKSIKKNELIILKEINNLYDDMIESAFSNITGLATRL